MRRQLFALLSVVFLLGTVTPAAFAHEVPDPSRTDCSIEVVVRYGSQDISGGTLTAIRVGDVVEEDGNFIFRRVHDGALVENVQSASAAGELLSFVRATEKNYDFETHTVSVRNGIGLFRNLDTGLYLLVQITPAESYSPMSPFLVSLPYKENGHYLYHVTAAAKAELEREPRPTAPPPSKPSGNLPQTGQLSWPVPLLAAAGLILFTLGWMLLFGQKKTNREIE